MRVATRAKTQSRRPRWGTRFASVGLAAAVAVGIASSPAFAQAGAPSAAGVVPELVDDNPDVSCAAGEIGFRIENPTVNQTLYEVDNTGHFFTLVLHPNAATGQTFEFNFVGSGYSTTKVVAKGGNEGANVFDYANQGFPNGIQADSLLHTPLTGNSGKYADLSHADFCVVPTRYSGGS